MRFRILIYAVLATCLFFWIPLATLVFSAEDSITFSWEILPESSIPIGYRIYQSGQDNTSLMRMIKDNILHSELSTPMQATCPVIVPDNAITTLYYAITAYNNTGESGFSNMVSKEFDTVIQDPPPLNPQKFTVEYTTDEGGNVTHMRVIR